MKRLIFLSLSSLLLAVAGCSKEAEPSTSTEVAVHAPAETIDPAPAHPAPLPDLRLSLGHSKPVEEIRFSADDRYLLTFGEDTMIVWETSTRRELLRAQNSAGAGMALSRDLGQGRFLLSGDREWAQLTLEPLILELLPAHGSMAYESPDGALFVFQDYKEEVIAIFETTSGKVETLPSKGRFVWISNDHEWVLLETDQGLQSLNRKTGQRHTFADLPGDFQIPENSSGPRIAVMETVYPNDYDPSVYPQPEPDRFLHRLDLATGEVSATYPLQLQGVSVRKIAWRDSNRLEFWGYNRGGIYDFETQSFEVDYNLKSPFVRKETVLLRDLDLANNQSLRLSDADGLHQCELLASSSGEVETTVPIGRDAKFKDLVFPPDAALSTDRQRAVCFNQKVIVVIDLAAGKVASVLDRAQIPLVEKSLAAVVLDRASNALIAAFHDPAPRLVALDPVNGRIETQFGQALIQLTTDSVSRPSGVWAFDRNERIVGVEFTEVGIRAKLLGGRGNIFTLSADGKTVALANYEQWDPVIGPISNYAARSEELSMFVSANQNPGPPWRVYLSPRAEVCGTHNGEVLHLVDVTTKESRLVLWRDQMDTYAGPTSKLEFSPDAQHALVQMQDEAGEQSWECYRLASGNDWQKRLWSIPAEFVKQVWPSSEGDWQVRTAETIQTRSLETGEILQEEPLPPTLRHEFHFSPDRSEFYILTAGRIRFFTTSNLEESASFAAPGEIENFQWSNNRELFIAALQDGVFSGIWRRDEAAGEFRYLGKCAFLDGGEQWILIDANNRFDASAGMEDQVFFVLNGETVPLGAAFEKLYTPRLFEALAGGVEIAPPVLTEDDLLHAPVVTIQLAEATRGLVVEDDVAEIQLESETCTVSVEASSRRGGIAELRFYVNGKLVGDGTRGLVVEDDVEDSATYQQRTYTVPLSPGFNEIKAIAVNEQRIESAPARLSIERIKAPKPGGMRLHVFAVGVNAYKNPRYNLNYATADAQGLVASVQTHAATLFNAIETTQLFDDNVTRERLLAAFDQIAEDAGPRDAFLFYYAGHGVMSEGKDSQFYLVPHDITQLYGNNEQLEAKGISSAELLEISRRIPAQKQLFVLDACQSAGALEAMGGFRGAAEERAIAQLARSSGTHWLTASGSEQFATEFEDLGHGVFTYALLAALAGEADAGDGSVTVNDLKSFLEARVPELTQEHRGTPQYPASFGYGQDFPVTLANP